LDAGNIKPAPSERGDGKGGKDGRAGKTGKTGRMGRARKWYARQESDYIEQYSEPSCPMAIYDTSSLGSNKILAGGMSDSE
jgi:hypothetical protein